MDSPPKHIKFRNHHNPGAAFDILKLEDLYKRNDLDHSPFHLHLVEFYMIILIENGTGTHTIDFTDYSFRPGSLLTVRKDQIHKFSRTNEAVGKLLLFTDEFLLSYLEKLEALKSIHLFNNLLGVPKIQLNEAEMLEVTAGIERINKEYFQTNDEYSFGVIRSELHILITKLFRIKSRSNLMISTRKYLREFILFQELVEKHVTNLKRVEDYAALLGLSTKTLNTTTRNIINKTAKEFIDDICTIQIKRLLINTELSVKEVAYATGFEETTNFYKYFKRQTGLTPLEFKSASY